MICFIYLVMLVLVNFGLVLVQLGKGVIGWLKVWFDGVELGQCIFDWLELGSVVLILFNLDCIYGGDLVISGQFLFVLIGDCFDCLFYDYFNSYIGEDGFDGVVCLVVVNFNVQYVVFSIQDSCGSGIDVFLFYFICGLCCVFKLILGVVYLGIVQGILVSVQLVIIDVILCCFVVCSVVDYVCLCDVFDSENVVCDVDKVELELVGLFVLCVYIYDLYSLFIVCFIDEVGELLKDVGLLFIVGLLLSVDLLLFGFLIDCQVNLYQCSSVLLFFNYSLLVGDVCVVDLCNLCKILCFVVLLYCFYGVCVQLVDFVGLVYYVLVVSVIVDDLFIVFGFYQSIVFDVVLLCKVYEGVF